MEMVVQAKKTYETPSLEIIKMKSEMLMKHFSWVYDGHGGTHEIAEDDWEGMANEGFWWDDYPEE